MHLSDRRPGSPNSRRRAKFRPRAESLEERQLLTTIDLAATQSTPYGVENIGQNNTGAATTVTGAGYTVTDVGDLTGSGYDDYVISADGLTTPSTSITAGTAPTFTGTSTAYLVFGSDEVNSSTPQNFAALAAGLRAGDLGQLGGLGDTTQTGYPGAQLNPTVQQPTTTGATLTPGFNYNGITLTTGAVPNSGLGFSVAALGDIDGSGHNSFAIGAPNDTGGGRVYIIYGSTALASLASGTLQAPKVLDLEAPTTGANGLVAAGVKVVTLDDATDAATDATAQQFGYSVAGLGNYINYGPTAPKDIGIGAPGFKSNAGAAFAISGNGLNGLASGTILDVSTTVVNNSYGMEYQGIAGSETGASVASGGDFDGYTKPTTGFTVDDFLIGAPGSNAAYLVYGEQFLATQNGVPDDTTGQIYQLSEIGTVPVAGQQNLPLEGLIFKNTVGSGLMGFSVATAGDYNGDGLSDVIIGAPGTGGVGGSASIFYGVPLFTPTNTTLNPRHIVGLYATPTVTPTTGIPLPLVYQDTSSSDDDFGFSVSYIGDIPGQGINGVAIGAPETTNGIGAAYVIPGNYQTPTSTNTSTFPSVVPISTAITSGTYAGFSMTVSNSFNGVGATNTPFLGTSVSGRSPLIPTTGTDSQQFSLDSDAIPDVFVGAPGFNLTNPNNPTDPTTARIDAGIAYGLEGTFLPQTAPNDVILTTAGVNSNNPAGTYSLPATGTSTFYIFSSAATSTVPAFDPTTDLTSPVTLTVNGVTFTNVTLTDGKDSTGADDASFVLSAAQIAMLNLTSGSTITISIRGLTNSTPGTVFVARATGVTVSAAGGGGSGGGGGVGLVGATAASILTPPIFTGIDYGLPSPPVSSLEHLTSYAPLPVTIAYQQFLPKEGFLAREEVALHPSKKGGAHQAPRGTVLNVAAIGHSESKYAKTNTLLQKVFTRGKLKLGKTVTFTHKVKVIPRSEQTETISS